GVTSPSSTSRWGVGTGHCPARNRRTRRAPGGTPVRAGRERCYGDTAAQAWTELSLTSCTESDPIMLSGWATLWLKVASPEGFAVKRTSVWLVLPDAQVLFSGNKPTM